MDIVFHDSAHDDILTTHVYVIKIEMNSELVQRESTEFISSE